MTSWSLFLKAVAQWHSLIRRNSKWFSGCVVLEHSVAPTNSSPVIPPLPILATPSTAPVTPYSARRLSHVCFVRIHSFCPPCALYAAQKPNIDYWITLILSGENYKLISFFRSANFPTYPLFHLSQIKNISFTLYLQTSTMKIFRQRTLLESRTEDLFTKGKQWKMHRT